ncbi:glycoside hydrolase family 2 protein [Chitinophaga sp. Hz27]|uniref:beta-mannosidase n=1 Tax=Chitinophaga sp. Hz27 TaxID=3347169 RepID=UPI0035DF900A
MNISNIGRFFTVVFFLMGFTKSIYSQEIQLSSGWEFARADEKIWRPATVPGTVHTDLLAQHLIPDPFKGTNEKNVQWVDKKDWEYHTKLPVTAEMLKQDVIELEFKGLDTYASIYVNDQLVKETDNMFLAYIIDIKKYLKQGENTLTVKFMSPIKHDMPFFLRDHVIYPAGNDASDMPLSVYARKAPYHYGWDWGPRLVTSGIWRPVILRAWSNAIIRDVTYTTSLQGKKAHVDMNITVSATRKGNYTLIPSFKFMNKEILTSVQSHLFNNVSIPVTLSTGDFSSAASFDVDAPQLWWPNGMGEQHLYDATVSLLKDKDVLSVKNKKVGLRSIEIVNKPDSAGESFYVKVNGRATFMKGANYIPQDNFLPRVTPEKYQQLFRDMQESNFNMVRVWGGGIYEDDLFYDLADKTGMLVWQDFLFACTLYPGDKNFLDNVKAEAIYNINRLKSHPSLALWCGNNEVGVAIKNWGWKDGYAYTDEQWTQLQQDYDKLFKDLLPSLVNKYDAGRFYFASSPISNWGTKEDFTKGDNHYWGVWHGMEWFEAFNERIPRFMSEYGFQSFPSLETIDSFATKEDYHIFSNVMQSHQKSPAKGNTAIKIYMDHYYRQPKDFSSFVYLSQVLQAEGMKMAIEAHRRNMPYCMGTLYWQLNDVWPGPSWSGRDYYGRWKALQYYAKRAFEPVILSTVEENNKLKTYLIADAIKAQDAVVEMKLMDLSGNIIWEKKTARIKLQEDKSLLVNEVPVDEILKGKGRKEVIFYAQLLINGNVKSPNIFYFAKAKDLDLPAPSISVLCKAGAEGEVNLHIKSDKLARNIRLSLNGTIDHEHFQDNYFDLLPGEEKVVKLNTYRKPEIIQPLVNVTSLVDSYKK